MGAWFLGIVRGLFAAIDKVVVWLVEILYDLLFQISNVQIFSNANIDAFSKRIGIILTIFMIFKLSFSFLTYIVNPDQFTDKSKGFSKLIQNIAVSLVLLVTYQFLFDKAMELQKTIVKNETIPKLIIGVDDPKNTENIKKGSTISFPLMAAFIVPNSELVADYPNCSSWFMTIPSTEGEPSKPSEKCPGIKEYKDDIASDRDDLGATSEDQIDHVVEQKDTNAMFDYLLRIKKGELFAFDYKFIISTACGVFAALILLSFCFDVAVRAVKLSFLRLIAPIPIISYIDPIKGEGIFKKWLSNVGKTYADLFIRLIAIFFAILIIQMVASADFSITDFDGNNISNPFVFIFIIIGALMFAKQFPKLIQDITGINLDSKMQLNPLKKIKEQTLGANAATALGAGAIGGLGAATGNLINRGKNFSDNVARNRVEGKRFARGREVLGALGSGVAGFAAGGLYSARSAAKSKKFVSGISEGVSKANTNRTQREIGREDGASAQGIIMAKVEDKLGLETKYQRMKRQVDNMKNISKSIDSVDKRMESEILKNKNANATFANAIDLKNKYESLRTADVNQIRNDAVQQYRTQKISVENKINDAKSYINKYGLNENSQFSINDAGNLKQRLVSSGMSTIDADTIVNEVRNKYSEYSDAQKDLSTKFVRAESDIANDAEAKHSQEIRDTQGAAFKAMTKAKDEYLQGVQSGMIEDVQVKTTYDAVVRTVEKSKDFDDATKQVFKNGKFEYIKKKSGSIEDKAIEIENSDEYKKAQAEHTNAGVREGSYNNYKNPNATKQ